MVAVDPLDRIRTSLKGRARGRQSELYWFAWDNYERIGLGEKGPGDRADWIAIAADLNKRGIKVRTKKVDGVWVMGPVTPNTARKTFEKVRRDYQEHHGMGRQICLPASTSSAVTKMGSEAPRVSRITMTPAKARE